MHHSPDCPTLDRARRRYRVWRYLDRHNPNQVPFFTQATHPFWQLPFVWFEVI
ncbi:hypothetical protein [Microcoleus sp. AR_TQ3_B6]|uniref:hypothetical protein n=1 Tax=Microcoleus sp. AR_TQ3_B6 TaxID=3055284 RepID=UPI002FD74F67